MGDDDGSGGRSSTAGNGGDEEEEAYSSGLTRVVWFRQMLHRWQLSSSNSATASASGEGERANDRGAWTDQTDIDAAGSSSEIRDPLLPASASAAAEDRPRRLPPRVVEERYYPDEGDSGGGGDSPMTPDALADVPRGCCPVYVGLLQEQRRRFVVPTAYLGMPVFRRLLEKAEEEFEFHYGCGGVTIPCDTEAFKYILLVMERHRQGLVDDEGNAKEEEKQRSGCGSSSEPQDQPTMETSSGAKAITLHGT